MPRRRKLFSTRRSKKIAPGVRITLTKKGPGMSVKVPGLGSYSTRTGKVRRSRKGRKKGCGAILLGVVAMAVAALALLVLMV